jgi:hypothetical protein
MSSLIAGLEAVVATSSPERACAQLEPQEARCELLQEAAEHTRQSKRIACSRTASTPAAAPSAQVQAVDRTPPGHPDEMAPVAQAVAPCERGPASHASVKYGARWQSGLPGNCGPPESVQAAVARSVECCPMKQVAAPHMLRQAGVEGQRCDHATSLRDSGMAATLVQFKDTEAHCKKTVKGDEMGTAQATGKGICDAEYAATPPYCPARRATCGCVHSSTSTCQPSPGDDGLGPLRALQGPVIRASDDGLSALKRLCHMAVEPRHVSMEGAGLTSPGLIGPEFGSPGSERSARRPKRKRGPNALRNNGLCAL